MKNRLKTTYKKQNNRGCDFREMKISTENKNRCEFFLSFHRLYLTHSQRASS